MGDISHDQMVSAKAGTLSTHAEHHVEYPFLSFSNQFFSFWSMANLHVRRDRRYCSKDTCRYGSVASRGSLVLRAYELKMAESQR